MRVLSTIFVANMSYEPHPNAPEAPATIFDQKLNILNTKFKLKNVMKQCCSEARVITHSRSSQL